MLTFIQLTDFHVGENSIEYANLEKIINHIIDRYKTNPHPLIIITGDFVDHGTNEEYSKVVYQLKKLTNSGFKIQPCAGNHDFGQGCDGHKLRHQPAARERYLKFIHNELLGENRSIENWNAGKTIFPIVTTFNSEKVLFVGLDTMNGVINSRFPFGKGKLDEDQAEIMVTILKDPQYNEYTKIVYMHHHLYSGRPTVRLIGRRKLQRILKDCGVDLVCCGHLHRFETFENPVRLVSGDKVTEPVNNNGSGKILEYYEYMVANKNIKMKCIQVG